MNESCVQERRQWFMHFPDGSIEFFLITRVLLILLLLVLVVAPQQHHAFVLLALAGLLWVDYALTLWWIVQIATDLDGIRHSVIADHAYWRRLRSITVTLLPSIVFMLLISPWPNLLSEVASERMAIWRIALPILGPLFLLLLFPAQRVLRGLGLESILGRCLMLVPLLHWFALHHWMLQLDKELNRLALETKQQQLTGSGPRAAVSLTFWVWFPGILPWLIILPAWAFGASWLSGLLFKWVAVCSLVFTCLFMIADTAAMENIQRKFVLIMRRLGC
ncbi:MAG: hypothetical protein GXY44_13805 [Phycisphaerales bacterium]|nr:hypothetical protein [Phycisphaerales bacterium]